MEKNKEQKDVEKRIVLQGSVEYNAEDKPPVIKGGIEENVIVKLPEIDVSEIEIGFESLLKDKGNSIDDLIADNKTEIAYLKTKQREQELEIKNRQENVKRLQEQKKAIRREERERQKLYNALKSDNIGLTKINVTTNKTSNYHPLVENVEPLIKSKQNQLVNQDEQNRSKNEYRASLFYPDDREETKLYLEKQKKVAEEQKREQKAQLETQIEARKNVKTLPISDVEKTLFKNGNLAEMDFAKSKEFGEEIVLKNHKNETFRNDVLSQSKMSDIINEINVIINELDDFAYSLKKDLVFYFKNLDMDNEVVNSYIDKKIFSYIFPGQFIKPLLIWWSTTSMLDKFYKSSEVNLSNSKEDLKIKNSMRHITGLARVAKAFSPREAVFYGAMKETLDILRELKEEKGKIRQEIWDDIRTDFSNNSIGIDFIKNNPNANNDEIMQFAYKHSMRKLKE